MSRARRGFSLLEIILATGILLGCLVVLSELAAIGRIHAGVASDTTTAARICQNKLNEILTGAAPIEPVREEAVEGEPGWLYSVEVDQPRQPGLVALRVTVWQESDSGKHPVEFSLVRWLRDPRQRAGELGVSGGGGLR